jgi:HK97 gp10 family phage protein
VRKNYIASSGTTKLEGVADLKRALDELGGELATKIGRAANRRAAAGMAEVMRQNAPYSSESDRSKASKTYGHLRDNIRVRQARARRSDTVSVKISVGRAFWGLFQEYGTKFMAARPWMRPSFDASVQVAIDAQIDELGKGIARTAKQARRRQKVPV